MNNMKKCNYVISAVTGCLGIVIMIFSGKLPLKFTASGPGAGFWPMILGGLFVLIAICLLIITIIRRNELAEIQVVFTAPANKRVYGIMGCILGYCILINLVGFYLASFIFIPVIMYIMDERNKRKMILTTLISVGAIYIIFGILLKTKMPVSIFL